VNVLYRTGDTRPGADGREARNGSATVQGRRQDQAAGGALSDLRVPGRRQGPLLRLARDVVGGEGRDPARVDSPLSESKGVFLRVRRPEGRRPTARTSAECSRRLSRPPGDRPRSAVHRGTECEGG